MKSGKGFARVGVEGAGPDATAWRRIGRSVFFLKFLAIGLAVLFVVAVTPLPSFAWQDTDLTIESGAEYNFGQVMRVWLKANAALPIERVTLNLHAPELPNTLTAEINVTAQEEIDVSYPLDLTKVRLAPFTTVTYWWVVEFEDGDNVKTEMQTIEYVDDQYDWNSQIHNGVEVYWIGDDPIVGQAAQDAVLNAQPKIEALIPIAAPEPLRVYVYPSAADLRAALRLTGRDWVGAHAHPELSVVLVVAGDSLSAESDLARSVPHELAHLYLYEATGEAYESIPLWFDEGLAGLVEESPNPNYATRLDEAVANRETIPFADLCYVLPDNEDRIVLAYAQSAALLAYIQSEYGDQALQQMIAAIANGGDCQSVTVRSLGISLADLEQHWLEHEAPQNVFERAWQNGRGWLLIIFAGFLLVGLLVGLPRGKNR